MVLILPIPEIREELRTAAKSGALVPFIGAGTSMLAGGPSWGSFADAAIRHFVTEGKLNLSQFEQIKHLSPRIKLSIAKSLQEEHNFGIPYEKILHPTSNSSTERGEKLYSYLTALSEIFVTTNYDNWLAKKYYAPEFTVTEPSEEKSQTPSTRRALYKPEDFTHDNLEAGTVFHLHGSLAAPEKMILTTEDYIRHYSNDRGKTENPVLTFLQTLFRLKNVLFIGYGLEELEILEYIIQKSTNAPEGESKDTRHFILQGFFTHEQVLADAMEKYFLRECGVQLLAFSKDENGYDQLLEVIKEFATHIPVAKPLLVQEFQEMGALLDG